MDTAKRVLAQQALSKCVTKESGVDAEFVGSSGIETAKELGMEKKENKSQSILTQEEHLWIRQRVREAGQKTRGLQEEQLEVIQKDKNELVTNFDRALDEYLRTEFHKRFPEDAIVTEEHEVSRANFFGPHQRTWCIDPIDGTNDFIKGGSEYAVMVGLLQAGEPVAGWLYPPKSYQQIFGAQDIGLHEENESRENGELSLASFEATPCPPITEDHCPILIGFTDAVRYGMDLKQKYPGITYHAAGSFGIKVLKVLKGEAGLYMYLNQRVKPWDTIAPIALAKAAGLECCDLQGNPIRYDKESIHPETLKHKQGILIGWPSYVQKLRPLIAEVLAENSTS